LSSCIALQGAAKDDKYRMPYENSGLKHDRFYHVGDRYMLEHNHPLLTVTYPNFPNDLEGTIRDLLKSEVDKSRLIDFVHLRTGCLLSRLQLALMESPDMRRAPEESDRSS
jgi:hypothetical protein